MNHANWNFNLTDLSKKESIRTLNRMKIKLRELMITCSTTSIESSISPQEDYLSILITIFSYNTDKGIELFRESLEKIKPRKEELCSMGIPILIGFYVMHAEIYPSFATEVWQFLLNQAEKDVKISHLIIFNLLTCKHTYKKHIEYTSLKRMICEVMNEYDYDITAISNDTSIHKDLKHYHSLFFSFDSFEDFVDKNLLRLDNTRKYVANGKIQMNHILLNLRKSSSEANSKWATYCSSLNFINDLIAISELLVKCPLRERERILNEFILLINNQCLPSRIYDPFAGNNDTHQSFLWKISEDYSYPISTKERVPCHLLFEFSNENNNTVGNNSFNDKREMKIEVKKDMVKSTSALNLGERPSIIIPRISKKDSSIWGLLGFGSSNDNDFPIQSTETSVKSTPPSSFFGTLLGCFSGNRREMEKNGNEEDSSNNTPDSIGIFGNKKFKDIQEEVLIKSKYHSMKNRYISSMIVKGNDDLRQDFFVSQIGKLFNNIFSSSNLDLHIQPLEVISNGNGGLIQTIVNSTNLMKINKLTFSSEYQEAQSSSSEVPEDANVGNLKNYFLYKYGRNTEGYHTALSNFISSLAGYSLLCYFLEVKDRNNANILIDDEGNLIHIDYGFLLSKSPGNISFEKAPFKFTSDFVNLLQGTGSQYFLKFQEVFEKGYRALREKSNLILAYVFIFSELFSDLPIFSERDMLISSLKEKFCFEKKNEEIMTHCNSLIFTSIDNWRTKAYDHFQKYCVGIN